LAYSAADVFVAPSIQEAFGKTLVESLACKTPVVCFDATGPAGIVEHKINGYKAKPFESEDIAKGIDWVVNKSDYNWLSDVARELALKKFDSSVIADKYINLYSGLLYKELK
jgi:glycosyltransferase involved in cell wall biosynthesis